MNPAWKKKRGPIMVNAWVALFLGLWINPGMAEPDPNKEALFAPFPGYAEHQVDLLLDLFRQDAVGRKLMRDATDKAGFDEPNDLVAMLSFCSEEELGGDPNRRGLFTRETAYFYREKGTTPWQEITEGGLARLAQPKSFPILEDRIEETRSFQLRTVAFRPAICLRKNLSLLQAYLVLFHELTHFTKLPAIPELDVTKLDPNNLEEEYYRATMEKPGGELDAFLAQIQAFDRLQKRYDIPANVALEGFLTWEGALRYREKEALLDLLLDQANYRQHFFWVLQEAIYRQYNTAYAWWSFLGEKAEGLRQQLSRMEAQRHLLEQNLAAAKAVENKVRADHIRNELRQLNRKYNQTQDNLRLVEMEKRDYRKTMDLLDAKFPEGN